MEQELLKRGGKHLVLVRYTPLHSIHRPWIYNSADVDRSSIVWAREMDEASLLPLLRYYADRQVWIVNPDAQNPKLTPYGERESPQIFAIQNAAGKAPFAGAGVSPGSLVTIFGANLGSAKSALGEGCLVSGSGVESAGSHESSGGGSNVNLPDLDASRPGVAVKSRREPLPASGGRSEFPQPGSGVRAERCVYANTPAAPDPQRLSVRFGDVSAPVLCVQQSNENPEEDAATHSGPARASGRICGRDRSLRRPRIGGEKRPNFSCESRHLAASGGWKEGRGAGACLMAAGSRRSIERAARRDAADVRYRHRRLSMARVRGAHLIVGVNNRGAPLEFVNCEGMRERYSPSWDSRSRRRRRPGS